VLFQPDRAGLDTEHQPHGLIFVPTLRVNG
jgi:hypothetical protein